MLFDRVLEKITEEKEFRMLVDLCDQKTNSSLQNIPSTPRGFFTPKLYLKGIPITN
jgi:hypothetical protein